MRLALRGVLAALLLAAVMGAAGLVYVKTTGLRGQPAPGLIETRVARTIRSFAVPS